MRLESDFDLLSANKFDKPFGVIVFATIINVAVLNIVLLFIARMIGPEAFGRYFFTFSLASVIILPAAYGLGAGATYILASNNHRGNLVMVVTVFIVFTALWTYLCYCFAPKIAILLGVYDKLVYYALFYSVPFATYLYMEYILRGYGLYSKIAVLRIFTSIGFLVTIGAIYFFGKLSLTTPLWGRALPYIVALLVFTKFVFHRIAPFNFKALPMFLKFSMGAALSSTAAVFFMSADKIILAGLVEPSALGVYSVHFIASFTVAGRLIEMINTVLFPESVRMKGQFNTSPKISSRIWKRTIIGWFALFILMILTQLLAIAILGTTFHSTIAIMVLFALGGSFYGVADARWWYLASFGHSAIRSFAIHAIIAALLLLGAMFKLTPMFGLLGATGALVIASTYSFISSVATQQRIDRIMRANPE